MKSKEEIKQLAQEVHFTSQYHGLNPDGCFNQYQGFIKGYSQCQKDMAKESIAFANFLKADFEMEDSGSSDDILWLLCGTRQTYTTDEIYNEFIKSRSLINSLNK